MRPGIAGIDLVSPGVRGREGQQSAPAGISVRDAHSVMPDSSDIDDQGAAARETLIGCFARRPVQNFLPGKSNRIGKTDSYRPIVLYDG